MTPYDLEWLMSNVYAGLILILLLGIYCGAKYLGRLLKLKQEKAAEAERLIRQALNNIPEDGEPFSKDYDYGRNN